MAGDGRTEELALGAAEKAAATDMLMSSCLLLIKPFHSIGLQTMVNAWF